MTTPAVADLDLDTLLTRAMRWANGPRREDDAVVQAIAELRRRNAIERDHRIDLALTRLRHRGAPEPPEVRPTPWPPVLDDPFPDTTGLVEITPDALDGTVLGGSILHHGALCIRGLVDPDTVDRLAAGIDRAFASFDRWMDGDKDDAAPWYVPFRPLPEYPSVAGRSDTGRTAKERAAARAFLLRWMRDGGGMFAPESPPVFTDTLEVLSRSGVHRAIGDYLGEWPVISFNKTVLRKVSPDGRPSWHQDGAFLGDDIRTVNVWISLTDCGGPDSDAPALDLVPERVELLETATEGAVIRNEVGPDLVNRLYGDDVIRPRFAAGDALCFDERFLHRSAISPSMTRPRYAIEAWHFAPSAFVEDYIPLAV